MYSVSPLTVGYLLHRSSSVYNISPLTVGYLYSVAQVTLSVQHIPSYSGLFVVCCTGHRQCTTYPLLQWVICILLHRSPSVYNISPLTVDYLWSVAQVTVSVQHIPSYSGLFVFCCTGHRQCTTYPLLQWIICGLLHRSPSVYNISPLTVGYLYSVAQVTISIQWTPSYITITGSNINILVGGGGGGWYSLPFVASFSMCCESTLKPSLLEAPLNGKCVVLKVACFLLKSLTPT